MKLIHFFKAGPTTALAGLLLCLPLLCAEAPAKEALALQLPAPTLKGTPEDLPKGPNIEPLTDKPRPPFMVPRGVTNVALGKPVTSSVAPFSGELNQITDGKKEAFDYDAVEFKKGTQWVQVDLGDAYSIYAIALWHDHRYIQVMHDVIVQVSDDPALKRTCRRSSTMTWTTRPLWARAPTANISKLTREKSSTPKA